MSAFTPEQVAYLESLPAVERVTAKRIRYTDAFRDACLRAYGNGAHPVDLFRAAGLDPRLVGYKRIERAFSRWRRESGMPAARSAGRPPIGGTGFRVGDVDGESATAGTREYVGADGTGTSMDTVAAGTRERVSDDSAAGCGPGTSSDRAGRSASCPIGSLVNSPADASAVFAPAAFGGADPRDLLIAQQMHYIRYLEQQLSRYSPN